jgi:hypothetical protein
LGCVREIEGDKKSKCIRESAFIGFARFDPIKQEVENKDKDELDKDPDNVNPKEMSPDPMKPDGSILHR